MCSHVAAPYLPQATVLQRYAHEHYPEWKAARAALREPVPFVVQRDIDLFLQCRDPGLGHATVACGECGFTRDLWYSCKRRWCPWCGTRRMHERAKAAIDVFAGYPVRHWIGCLPNPLRYGMGYDPDLVTGGVNAFVNAIFHHQVWQAKAAFNLTSVNLALTSAATFIHRVSADLSTNVHFHVISLDGVLTEDAASGSLVFRRLDPPTPEEIAAVAQRMCRKTCTMLERRGYWHPTHDDTEAGSVEGTLTLPGWRPERATFHGEAAQDPKDGKKPRAGIAFNVHATRSVEASDRDELEQLVRYVLAPPVADRQLSVDRDGNMVVQLKRSRYDGSTEIAYDPHQLLDRIAALVHRPRARLIRLHGVAAPNSRVRRMAYHEREQGSPNRIRQTNQHRQQLEEARAKLFLYARYAADRVLSCPVCLNRLHLVAIDSPRFKYRNPRWIHPDTPIES